eukprot:TRINITY_DN49549_c0_g2_i1.p1 TRINITY_DN49549_c0_g2~~TRINITY_DN49549_c0_g2_i1.p1  ORF type:complete len:233 (+),score=50.55 TRINITY_DN49549_c0_g2_i1:313-1011(+)
MPLAMLRIWIVQFWSFFGLFIIMVNGVNFFAQEIAQGDSDADDGTPAKEAYLQGCHAANLAFAGMCAVGLVVSFGVPKAIARFGVQKLEVVNLGIMSLVLCLLAICHTQLAAQLTFLLLGVSWGLTIIVPWYAFNVLVSNLECKGTVTGIFNWSQCVPEVVVSILGAVALELSGGNIRVVLVLGAVGAGIGLFCCTRIIEPTGIVYSQLPGQEENHDCDNSEPGCGDASTYM